MYIRICLGAFSSGGNVLLSFVITLFMKKEHIQVLDLMSHRVYSLVKMVGHSIVVISDCSLYYKIILIFRFLCCTCNLLWEGFHILFISLHLLIIVISLGLES